MHRFMKLQQQHALRPCIRTLQGTMLRVALQLHMGSSRDPSSSMALWAQDQGPCHLTGSS
jgi:hypothetical protein